MSTWGVELFDDDNAVAARDQYLDMLDTGHAPDVAAERILAEARDNDDDELIVVTLAIADTQLREGEVTDSVVDAALKYLQSGAALALWANATLQARDERSLVLDALYVRITE